MEPVGGKVSELRIDFGPGDRLCCTMRGRQLILLLCGGDKSTQSADIRKAQTMATEFRKCDEVSAAAINAAPAGPGP